MERDGRAQGTDELRQSLGRGLRWLVGLRLGVGLIFLGSAAALQLRETGPFPQTPLFGLIGVIFFLSLTYALTLRRVRNLLLFCRLQISVDLLLITGLVHFTGGVDSFFSFAYIFPIFAASTLLGRRDSLLAASVSGIFYGALVDLEYYRIIPRADFLLSAGPREGGYTVFQVFVNLVAFLLVALLSSHLAERLREAGRRLEAQEIDLRNLQTLHRDIVATIPSGLMTLDLRGRVVSFNQAAGQITGFSFAEVRDRGYPEGPFAGVQELRAFFDDGGADLPAKAFEVEIERRDGPKIPVGVSLTPLRDGVGRPIGLVVVFQDLTDRRRIEEQLRQADRLAAAGHLAAGIAHEIRNPLAAISGCIEVLRGQLPLAPQDRQLLDVVLREAQRLKLITGQFLDFVKPRQVTAGPCPLWPLLEETLTLLERGAERHPDTRLRLTGDRALSVLADADQLKQVFWNIGLNALQAMPSGGTVAVRAVARGEGGARWAAVEFEDNGPGLPAEEVPKIFDPFYTTRDAGTGLGLTIARRLTEGMGGTIEVESRPGRGTTFRLRFPLVPSPPAPLAGRGASEMA